MKRRKLESGEDYNWTDYMSLSFTQNVRVPLIEINYPFILFLY